MISSRIFDVERAILTGAIVERQENHVSGEWKYLVAGESNPSAMT